MLTNPSPPAEDDAQLGATRPCAVLDALRLAGEALPTVFLAPLSGITDVPFRALVRSFGTKMVYSEMVASGEILRGDAESRLRAAADGRGLHAVQLAGRDADAMEAAARLVADEGADLVDINMGCPAKKVVGGLSGASLMRDLDHATRLIEATVRGAGTVPVTLKMRLGWDRSSINAPELARRAEGAGIRLVTVHGRTRDQFYEGTADWTAIRAVKATVSIPVVANGDLVAVGQLEPMRRASGADAVMVGRGACGRPWFPAILADEMSEASWRRSLADLVAAHYEAMLHHYGASVGMRHARKHLGWYLDVFAQATASDLLADRSALLREADPALVARRLKALFGRSTIADVERPDATDRKAA